MKKKYELVKESVIEEEYSGVNLYRIRALKDFCDIKKGDLGGYVESEENLGQEGNCWIYDDAKVYGYAKVYDDAEVYGNAKVYDKAEVYGNASVSGNAIIADNAIICEHAKVYCNAKIYGDARIYGNASVTDNAEIYDRTVISGNCWISDNARVHGDATLLENAKVYDKAEVYGNASVSGNAIIHDKALVLDRCIIEDAEICKNAVISGNIKISNGTKIGENAIIRSSQKYITIGPIDDSDSITFYLTATEFLFVMHECYEGGIDGFMDYIVKEVDEKYKNVYLAAVDLAKAKLPSKPELKIPSTADIENTLKLIGNNLI